MVTIPFDFHLGNKPLPAGNYVVSRSFGSDDSILSIDSASHSHRLFFPTTARSERAVPAEAGLVFNRYGSQYYLAQVWRSGGQIVLSLHKSRGERLLQRELAENGSTGPVQVLAAAQ
jgi:hypothetical protein